MHDDVGADAFLFALGDGVAVRALGFPFVGLVGAVGAGDDGDLVGDHEGGVEADAELADDVDVRALLGGVVDAALEGHGAALGDDAEVGFELFLGHADAVIGDGDGARTLIHGHEDAEILAVQAHLVVRQGQVAELVNGVRGVGNDLAQEDLLVGVDGVDHEVEQPFALGLELLLGHIFVFLPRNNI